ncbi:EamA family transporter [Methylomicrobium sp. Wu6]|uniref:EamA family transporter n=1 Tax=Methylomicrobium sp. Wu6 TaxID=3107928 RepID=UPI002DD68DEB|nr:EamA family transporter [Methylomicrobium sp. Wu6]MEC4749269.1 EamA family transporter [Methylomicrobium sp. Wu6]
MEIVFVFGRLFLSSISNVIQKQLSHQGLHPFYIVATTYAVLAVLALPFFINGAFSELSTSFWINVFLASLLDVGGWMFMVMSLSKTDLSVFGPLNAYKVVISMLFALVFLDEMPTLQGFAGVIVIVAGSFFLLPPANGAAPNRFATLLQDRGVQARFLSILLFSIGTVFLKGSLEHSTPLETLIFWSWFGLPMVLLANALLKTESLTDNVKKSQPHLLLMTAVGLTVFVMQYLTLVLLSQMLIAYTLALFQLGMLLQVFLGHRIFNEPHLVRRLIGSLVMVLGSLLVLQVY